MTSLEKTFISKYIFQALNQRVFFLYCAKKPYNPMNMTDVESARYSDSPDILCSIKLLNSNLLLYTTNTYKDILKCLDIVPSPVCLKGLQFWVILIPSTFKTCH